MMPTNAIQVVLDTNVLISAFRSKRGVSYALFEKLGDPRWKTNLSTTLILEYEQGLKNEFTRQGQDLAVADAVLDVLVLASNARRIFFRWRPTLPDPKDDFLLELAVASGSEFIVP
jgi:putative PIN family toxin of toxin-antitoxin system